MADEYGGRGQKLGPAMSVRGLGLLVTAALHLALGAYLASCRASMPSFEVKAVRTRLEFISVPVRSHSPSRSRGLIQPLTAAKDTDAVSSSLTAKHQSSQDVNEGQESAGPNGRDESPLAIQSEDWFRPSAAEATQGETQQAIFRRGNKNFGEATPRMAIKMKAPINGHRVITGVSKAIGLWPPGYTDDPCPDLKKDVERFMSKPSESGREQYERNAELMTRYCR